MNVKQNHHDDGNASSSSSTKRVKTCDNDGASPWSNLNHDLLFLVMMQLGIFDFLPFSRVCKSWRSLALSNKNIFILSRPPMFISIIRDRYIKKNYCHLQDFEGRRHDTILPLSTCLTFFGLSCGYLILFGNARHDFWLVNPITGHQLHFPTYDRTSGKPNMGILLFSRSISRWVFAISRRFSKTISYYTQGKRGWTVYMSDLPIYDLHAFKGKIYTLHTDGCVSELRLNPYFRLWLLKTKNFPNPSLRHPVFVSSGEKLYVTNRYYKFKVEDENKVLELDFREMEWVSPEKSIGKYGIFLSEYAYSSAIKQESWAWADPRTQCKIYDYFRHENNGNHNQPRSGMFFYADKWYFPNDCLKVNLVD